MKTPRTPWYAKAFALSVVAYTLSPIDLIPDPIPAVGYLEDLVFLPLGFLLNMRFVPPEVMAECRERERRAGMLRSRGRRVAAAVIVALWLGTAVVLMHIACRLLSFPR